MRHVEDDEFVYVDSVPRHSKRGQDMLRKKTSGNPVEATDRKRKRGRQDAAAASDTSVNTAKKMKPTDADSDQKAPGHIARLC